MVLSGLGLRYLVWPKLAEQLNDTSALQTLVDQALTERGLRKPFELKITGARGAFLDWWTPGLTVEEVRLTQADQTLLRLGSLQARFGLRSLWSLVSGEPVFAKLAIESLQLHLVRQADGGMRLMGLPLTPGGAVGLPPQLTQWLIEQGPLSLLRAELTWQDQVSGQRGQMTASDLRAHFGRLSSQLSVGTLGLGPLGQWLDLVRGIRGLSGEVRDVSIQYDAPLTSLSDSALSLSQLSQVKLSAQVRDLGLPAVGPLARLAGLSGQLHWRDAKALFDLDAQSVDLAMPTVFQTPNIRLDQLVVKGHLMVDVSQTTPGSAKAGPWRLEIDQAMARNSDLRVDLKGSYEYATQSPRLTLSGTIGGLNPQKLSGYLPTEVGQEARDWLKAALGPGRPVSGDFVLKGDPDRFPFQEPAEGEFRVRLKAEDQRLVFAPDWPAMQGVFADVVFDRASMTVTSRQARLGNAPLSDVTATIDDVMADDPVLQLKGHFQTGLQSMVDTVNRSPVSEMLSGLTQGAVVKGDARLNLSLRIPLNDTDRTTVQGQLAFDRNQVLLSGGIPQVTDLMGDLSFTERGLSGLALKAQALGSHFSLSQQASTEKGQTRLKAQGQLTGPGLSAWMAQSLGVEFKDVLKGQTHYGLTLSAQSSEVRLQVDSDLKGLAVDLPDPLAKKADQAWPISLSLLQRPERRVGAGPTRQRQDWRLESQNNRLSVFARQVIQAGEVQEARGLMKIGQAAARSSAADELPKTTGLVVRLMADAVSLDQWLSALEQRVQVVQAPQDAQVSKGARGSKASPPAQSLQLTRVEVKTPLLTIGEHAMREVDVQAAPQSGAWSIDLKSQASAGRIIWQTDRRGRGKMIARLSRLWLDAPTEERTRPETEREIERSLTSISEAKRWPVIDLVAEDFRRGPKQFGRLTLDAAPDSNADRWRINALEISSPDATLKASGSWAAVPGGTTSVSPSNRGPASETRLSVSMSVQSAEGLLSRLGYGGLLRATPGEVNGELRWRGSPTDFRVQTMAGQIALDLKSGQFLKAEPGLSKLISVVNLQSLPKRISLDFRDIFSQGFAYERVRGDVAFGNGQAVTTNLRIVGVQASVFIDSQADLLAETQNTRVLVLPELNAGLASLGYALVNPAIGLGSFLAQYVLRDPLRKILAYEYQLTGSWADPQVKELSRTEAAEKAQRETQQGR
ncbi:MAG: YhdP family protein [Burkholderiaceae bacterium]